MRFSTLSPSAMLLIAPYGCALNLCRFTVFEDLDRQEVYKYSCCTLHPVKIHIRRNTISSDTRIQELLRLNKGLLHTS